MHRETLAWVKEWDFCVFGPSKLAGKRMRKRPREEEQGAGGKTSEGKWGDEWNEKPDEWRRPKEKVSIGTLA